MNFCATGIDKMHHNFTRLISENIIYLSLLHVFFTQLTLFCLSFPKFFFCCVFFHKLQRSQDQVHEPKIIEKNRCLLLMFSKYFNWIYLSLIMTGNVVHMASGTHGTWHFVLQKYITY